MIGKFPHPVPGRKLINMTINHTISL